MIMPNATTTLKTRSGNIVTFSSKIDSRISSVYQANGGQSVSIVASSERNAK